MADTSDLTRAILAARHFENLLKERYRAWGNGLGGKTRSVARNLRRDVVDQLLYVAKVSNRMRHERVDTFPDKRRFEEACTALETFFKEAIVRESPNTRSWLEAYPVGFWPTRADSSIPKRLFTVNAGVVRVYPPGTYWIRNVRGATDAGYACMLPLSLESLEARPLRSRDDLGFGLSLDLSAAILDNEAAIAAVVLTEEEQIRIAQAHVLRALQRICSEMSYDAITLSLHNIADQLKSVVNDMMSPGQGSVFTITSCAVVGCELDDTEVGEIWLERRRLSEVAGKRAEEQRHATELERLETELRRNRSVFEQELARAAAAHETELQTLRANGRAEQERLQQQLAKEKALAEQELAVAELELARAKADVAALPAGKHVLFPDQAFGIDRQRLVRDAEVWRATFSDRKLQQLLILASQAGFTQAQVQSLETIASQMAGITLAEKPLSLQERNQQETLPTPPADRREDDAPGEKPRGNVT